jgi:acylphosphatase
MSSPAVKAETNCVQCGAPLSASLRHYPTCQADAGAPNIRACCTSENLNALHKRFNDAKVRALANGYSREFTDFLSLIENEPGVVVSMPASIARRLVEDVKTLYAGYYAAK